MTNEEVALKQMNRGNKKYSLQKEMTSVERGIMTDEQRTEHIRMCNLAVYTLNKQIVNMLYTQARMCHSIMFLQTSSNDAIRDNRKAIDDDFFVAQQIIETDQIK